MRLVLSRFVEGDLDAIVASIAQDNPRRAITFIEAIRAKFRGRSWPSGNVQPVIRRA